MEFLSDCGAQRAACGERQARSTRTLTSLVGAQGYGIVHG